MCGKKSKVEAATPAATPVAAPLKIDSEVADTKRENGNTKAKGKRKLTINQIGSGTGVNL